MALVKESVLRAALVEQGFRVEDKSDGTGFTVYGEPRADNGSSAAASGIVQVHHSSLGKEDVSVRSVMNELARIGFDARKMGVKPAKEKTTLTRADLERDLVGEELHDPVVPYTERPLTVAEAVVYLERHRGITISASGLLSNISRGKLPAETTTSERGTTKYLIQPADLDKFERSRGGPKAKSSVTVKHTDTPAGRLSEAVAQARTARKKMESAFADLLAALDVIDAETAGALEELAEFKKRRREMERHLEKAVELL